MAFELENIKAIPSNERATLAAVVSVQQVVAAARQCVEIVDACTLRAPEGAEGILDALCGRSDGRVKCTQFYALYLASLVIVNDFKADDDDPIEEDKITVEQVKAAIARME